MSYNILVINPGSTSDDIGYYKGDTVVFDLKLDYTPQELAPFEGKNVTEMAPLKKRMILGLLEEHEVNPKEIDVVVGRGGLTKPVEGGAYRINEAMIRDLIKGVQGIHPCNLGGILAKEIADEIGCQSLISDSEVIDELSPLARYSGLPELPKKSILHGLNQKRVAHLTADKLGKPYTECSFVVLHGGGGVTIGAHINGRIVDVNNGLDGEGPMTPQRSGTLPTSDLAKLCFSGKYTPQEIALKIRGRGGVFAHCGTHDLRDISNYIDTGVKAPGSTISCSREKAAEVRDAMIYQFSKYIGYMAAVAEGKLDAVILTGGLLANPYISEALKKKTEWLKVPIFIYPGSDEKAALKEAATRALDNPETIKEYI